MNSDTLSGYSRAIQDVRVLLRHVSTLAGKDQENMDIIRSIMRKLELDLNAMLDAAKEGAPSPLDQQRSVEQSRQINQRAGQSASNPEGRPVQKTDPTPKSSRQTTVSNSETSANLSELDRDPSGQTMMPKHIRTIDKGPA